MGQGLLFEVQEKGRFKPLTEEGWAKTFYASPIDFGGGVPGSQPNMKESVLQQVEIDESH